MAHEGRNDGTVTIDVTEIPKEASSSKARDSDSILAVKQSNRFEALNGMVDDAATEPRAT